MITSLKEKLDLNRDKDFEHNQHIISNEMESLFDELWERLRAQKPGTVCAKAEPESLENYGEKYELSELAQKDEQAVHIYPCSVGESTFPFQRDREKIVRSKAFRRLVDKAQIFSSEKGDYYRTRMTHSLEVNQIAKSISHALRLNLDLTEAIALGHDLGHTPFGHQGERTLDDILSGKINIGLHVSPQMFAARCFGGFKHNYQSARILTEIEEQYIDFPGLNVSVQVVEGVLKHTRLKHGIISLSDFLSQEYIEKIHISEEEVQICSTLEGQVVAIADEIAQRGHDIDDALTSGVITIEELQDRLKLRKCSELSVRIEDELRAIKTTSHIIIDEAELMISRIVSVISDFFIEKIIDNSLKQVAKDGQAVRIGFPEDVEEISRYLEKVIQKKVICNSEVARADYNASMVVQKLFTTYYNNPRLLHYGTIHKIFVDTLQHKNKAVAASAINLLDGSIRLVNEEIEEITSRELSSPKLLAYLQQKKEHPDKAMFCIDEDVVIFEKRRILVRAIVDYIAGMTDGYALQEFHKLV